MANLDKIVKRLTWFSVIIIVAAVFYFWHLGRADIITDESSLATRAIKMVDFDFGIEQPTPWQWVDKIPWWMRLSFHDHPPLVFLAQHFSMRLFGENPWAIRLPSVIAGLASVLLLYLIGKRLYSPIVGLTSAALFAATANHVWISRIGLQESILIAMMLASIYCFSRLLTHPASVSIGRPIDTDRKKEGGYRLTNVRWLMASAVFLGLAFLAKYLALILVPIYLTILLARRESRHLLRSLSFLVSVLVFIAVASPVIVYNIQLYRNFGHFDFQFSQLFGQQVKEWPSRPGQDSLGSYSERVKNYIPRLIQANSPYFLMFASAGLAVIASQLMRRHQHTATLVVSHWSLGIIFAWLLPFFIFVGPASRFFAVLTPFLALAAGCFLAKVYAHQNKLKVLIRIVLAAIVIGEVVYSYNSVIALEPRGEKPWAYSDVRRQALALGYNQLNEFIDKELEGKMPEVAVTFDYPFAREMLNQAVREGQREGLKPVPWGIVFNDDFNQSAQLWVLLRRITYRGWPITNTENFLNGGGMDFYRKLGVKKMYAINPVRTGASRPANGSIILPLAPFLDTADGSRRRSNGVNTLEEDLRGKGAKPREIKNPKGEVAFRVYEFELEK